MNEHDATEIAFKNGYEKAAREIFEEIEKSLYSMETPIGKYQVLASPDFAELKKKYIGEKENEN